MRLTLPLLLALSLSACGGGGASTGTTLGGGAVGVPAPPAAAPLQRGSVATAAALVPVTASGHSLPRLDPAVFTALLESVQSGVTKITGEPKCAVTTYTVRYNTVGAAGEATTASAAIMVPSGADVSCSGSRPVLLYAHGTVIEQASDMSNLVANTEARLVAAMFAAQGFTVVAPNYSGYAGSTLAYHPYLIAEAQAADMIDALRAARSSFAGIGALDSGKLFVGGYSQGGYVAVATQRAMQTQFPTEFALTATAGMSGPYALAQFGDAIFAGAPRIGATSVIPLLINAGQRAGAGLYTQTSDIYEAKYASGIDTLLPSSMSLGDLINAGKLPATALFAADSLPQAADAGLYFGSGNLVKSSYRAAYLADAAAHPCSVGNSAPLACAPAHPLRKLLVKNDLRTFTPTAPLMLCGANGDPTVPYLNTVSALAYFRINAPGVVEVDLDTFPSGSDPYATQKLSFGTAKAALYLSATLSGDSGNDAVRTNYHAGLAPPFCFQSARIFFQAALAK